MSAPRHLRARRAPAPWSRRKRILVVTACVAALALVVAASVAGYLLAKYNSIDRHDLDTDSAGSGEPKNYLVVGSDARDDGSVEGHRSDVIMVVRVDPGDEAAAVLSIPRDLVVPIAGTGERHRINAAYAVDDPDQGRQRLVDTVTDNFDIPIHHYVEIDFAGFARMVDAAGGVPLFFEAAVRDRESGLLQPELGCVTLSGEEALLFVRSRHLERMTEDGWDVDPTGDLGRITRQQIFMREALSRVVDMASHPLEVRTMIDIAVDTVGLDDGTGIGDLRDLAERFRDFDADRLRTHALPVVANDDGATVSVDDEQAGPVLDVFRGAEAVEGEAPVEPDAPDPTAVAAEDVRVTVLNGTGEARQAGDVSDALAVAGFDVTAPGDASARRDETAVRHAPGDEGAARRLARQLSGAVVYEVDESLETGAVTLVTGADFTGVADAPATPDELVAPDPTTPGTGESASGTEDGGSPSPSTTVGFAVGDPPEGVDC